MLKRLKKVGSTLTLSAVGVAFTAVPALASPAGSSAVDAIKSGIDETKTQFMAVLAVVVTGAMGFFAVKYAINNGIGFFSKISKKG